MGGRRLFLGTVRNTLRNQVREGAIQSLPIIRNLTSIQATSTCGIVDTRCDRLELRSNCTSIIHLDDFRPGFYPWAFVLPRIIIFAPYRYDKFIMNETRVQEATVLSHGPDSDCPPLLDTIESNPRVADEATGPRLNRSTPPPSNFDFARLCDQWKGVGVSFRDDDGAGDRDSRHLMKPDRCNRQCDGCKILLRAVRPIKAMISSREGRQLASRDELQCQVRLRSHTKASFLSIANPSMLGPAASIYAAKGMLESHFVQFSTRFSSTCLKHLFKLQPKEFFLMNHHRCRRCQPMESHR